VGHTRSVATLLSWTWTLKMDKLEPINIDKWLDSDGMIAPADDGTLPPVELPEDHFAQPSMDEGHEYEVIADPSGGPEDWAVLLNEPEYKDVVVRYISIEIDPKMGTMEFEYQVMYVPEGSTLPNPEIFSMYLSNVLASVVSKYSQEDAVQYETIDDESI